MYSASSVSCDNKFPPTPSKKYVKLALVEKGGKCRDLDELMKHTLLGKVDEILVGKTEITTDDILKQEDEGRPPKVVLVEGPPGIGKSTLAWELCRRWDRAQYDLVVLLRLRELEHMDDIEDLFPHDDKELRSSVAKEVLERYGKGVLFVLDGYDELSSSLKSSSLLKRLLKGESLPECTILVSSRPSASHDLYRICRPQIKRHVEILGFTQENIKEYATIVFSSEPELLKDFLFYVSASENPAINSLMYIPLNAAIIVEIYSHTRKRGLPIPKTLTQLYTQLCLILVQREVAISSSVLTKLSDIPAEYSTHFQRLSKLAYKTFREQKLVFYSDSVPHASDFVHFGMLDSVASLYSGSGVSYNFLHLTLQEFLAAYHITQLPNGMDVFKEYWEDPRWNLVWKFVSGLTCFQFFKTIIKDNVFLVSEDEHLEVRMFLMECLFEAQFHLDFTEYEKDKIVVKSGKESCPLDRYALGYCIAHSSSKVSWIVALESNSDEGFMWGFKSASSVSGNLEFLSLSLVEPACLEQYPIQILGRIKQLHLRIRCADMKPPYSKRHQAMVSFLVKAIPHMNSLTSLSIVFSNIFITPELFPAILRSNVTDLKLCYQQLTVGPLVGSYKPNADKFYISLAVLMRSEKLRSLNFSIEPTTMHESALFQMTVDNDPKRLFDILFGPSCLSSLSVSLHSIALTENCLDSLMSNTSLTTVRVMSSEVYTYPMNYFKILSKLIISNKTLQVLEFGCMCNISKSIMKDLSLFTSALHENKTLQKLTVCFPSDCRGLLSCGNVDSRLSFTYL